MCSRLLNELISGKEIDFSAEEVERTYYNLVRAKSVSLIWRKFKPANQINQVNAAN